MQSTDMVYSSMIQFWGGGVVIISDIWKAVILFCIIIACHTTQGSTVICIPTILYRSVRVGRVTLILLTNNVQFL